MVSRLIGLALVAGGCLIAGPPSRTLDLPLDVFAPKKAYSWSKGFLVFVDHEAPADPARSHITVYDRDGRLAYGIRVSFPEARTVVINDAIVIDDQGTSVASGGSVGYSGEVTAFLIWIDGAGQTRRMIPTNPFLARNICSAADGSIWAFGMNDNIRADHEVVRRFSHDGTLLGKYVSRSSFKTRSHPSLHANLGKAFIQASADRVGVYSPNAREWLELSLDGTLLGRWTIALPKAELPNAPPGTTLRVVGLAFTDDNTVIGALDRGFNSGIYELDRTGGRWVRVEDEAFGNEYASICGTEGGQIIRRARYVGSTQRFGWFSVP